MVEMDFASFKDRRVQQYGFKIPRLDSYDCGFEETQGFEVGIHNAETLHLLCVKFECLKTWLCAREKFLSSCSSLLEAEPIELGLTLNFCTVH